MAEAKELVVRVSGRWTDGPVHDAILGDRSADETLADLAVRRAVRDGMEQGLAERLYRGRT